MKKMELPHVKLNTIILFVVLMVSSVSLIFYDTKHHQNSVRNIIQANISLPVKSMVNWPRSLWVDIKHFLGKQSQLISENKAQKREIIWLKANLANVTTIEAENTRLKLLLDSTLVRAKPVVIAEIIDSQVNESKHQIEINKGSEQSASLGQIVIDEKGVIGQITKVYKNTSIVSLITDSRQNVPVYIERNRLRMVSSGIGRLDELKIDFVALDADIKVGDKLVTSGLGHRYPRGYALGIVTKVNKSPTHQFATVVAKPVAALNKVLEVLLVQSDAEATDSSLD